MVLHMFAFNAVTIQGRVLLLNVLNCIVLGKTDNMLGLVATSEMDTLQYKVYTITTHKREAVTKIVFM